MSNIFTAIDNTSIERLTDFLKEHGVDISQYGKDGKDGSKDLEDLYTEIALGEATLEYNASIQQVIRRTRVINIDVLYNHPERGLMKLYEEKQVFKGERSDERVREHLTVAVSEKQGMQENSIAGAIRACKEELSLIIDTSQLTLQNISEAQRSSDSFPGIVGYYNVSTLKLILTPEQFREIEEGHVEVGEKKDTYFKWK